MSLEELDQARGGLLLTDGVELSFGLTRIVSVNGEVASLTSLNTSLGSGDAASLALQRSASNIIQIGEQNAVAPSVVEALQAGVGTVIQNSLDQQLIQTETVIDIVIKNIDFGSGASALNSGFFNQLVLDAAK